MPRLHVRGVFQGYRRNKNNQDENAAILRLEGVKTTPEARWYMGKRVAYVYRCGKKGKKEVRMIWGRIARPHGTTGAVRARFRKNLPAHAMGKNVRVMLYPSNV